jgi:hypothetical protein
MRSPMRSGGMAWQNERGKFEGHELSMARLISASVQALMLSQLRPNVIGNVEVVHHIPLG